jgi:hypothetical protein
VSYFRLNKEQTRYLRDLVKGKVVADLGCGGGELTRLMARWGATTVHSVDKCSPWPSRGRIQRHEVYFKEWRMPSDVEVAAVAWPQNNLLPGLQELLQAVPHVVYLGKNTDWTQCGNPGLMRYLSGREALHHLPSPQNVLIHYGPGPRSTDEVYHEEFAGMSNTTDPIYYNPSTDRRTEKLWGTDPSRA